jgi:hypothetical protein
MKQDIFEISNNTEKWLTEGMPPAAAMSRKTSNADFPSFMVMHASNSSENLLNVKQERFQQTHDHACTNAGFP